MLPKMEILLGCRDLDLKSHADKVVPNRLMSKLRVFTSPSAFPNPQRLRLFMFEKGIDGEIEEIIYDMTPGGEQRRWQHLKMNLVCTN